MVTKSSIKNIQYVDCLYTVFRESVFCKTESVCQLLTLGQSQEVTAFPLNNIAPTFNKI